MFKDFKCVCAVLPTEPQVPPCQLEFGSLIRPTCKFVSEFAPVKYNINRILHYYTILCSRGLVSKSGFVLGPYFIYLFIYCGQVNLSQTSYQYMIRPTIFFFLCKIIHM